MNGIFIMCLTNGDNLFSVRNKQDGSRLIRSSVNKRITSVVNHIDNTMNKTGLYYVHNPRVNIMMVSTLFKGLSING